MALACISLACRVRLLASVCFFPPSELVLLSPFETLVNGLSTLQLQQPVCAEVVGIEVKDAAPAAAI